MAVPKNKKSKAKTRGRKAINMRLNTLNLVECKNCGNKVLPHRVCLKCGFYKEKQILDVEGMT